MKHKESTCEARPLTQLYRGALLLTLAGIGFPAWCASTTAPSLAENPRPVSTPPTLDTSTVATGANHDSSASLTAGREQKPRGRLRDRFDNFSYTNELPPGLTIEEFESALETQFYGTYIFYSNLSQNNRLQIYQGYRDERHIASIRASTLELLR